MGHGKETPRQKMIGMMYLVLMAMLALNVSNEVLNAFDVLDEGLKRTIETLDQTNNKVIVDFQGQYELNKEKVGPWRDLAEEVKKRADDIYEFIHNAKIQILENAKEDLEHIVDEEHKVVNSALIKSRDKTDPPAYVMIGDNNDKLARDLKVMIDEYREFLINTVVVAENADAIRASILSALDTSEKDFGHGKKKKNEMPSWERQHFEQLPLSGVMTIMAGLQINIRNAEGEALKYLYGQISAGDVSFNKIEATVIPNSNYIIRGNEYRAEVFMAASDTTADPEIYVTNNPRPYDSVEIAPNEYEYMRRDDIEYQRLEVPKGSGKGIFTAPGSSLGAKSWGGTIELTSPAGKIVRPFKKEYLVMEGSVSVAATKMNVFYLGVDNPVEVSVAGVSPDKIDISVTNARHIKDGDGYIIRPIRPGNAYVVVYATIDGARREMGREEFRVRTVPNPVAVVNKQKGGSIKQSILAVQLGVFAEMENFDFDLTFTITQFTVSAVIGGFVREFSSKSNRFTPEQMNLIKNLSRGNSVYIQDIKAVGPDGQTRNLSPMNFRLE